MNTKTQKFVTLKEKVIKEKNLILFNDDVNTFDHVIDMLVKICKHELIQAEQCASIVHYSGKCAIKNGTFEKLEPMFTALSDSGLTVEIN